MRVHNFKELQVWKNAIELAEFIYRLTTNFPREEKFGLTSQIQRCAVSIPSNIAEGAGRVSKKEFQHFISIAMGSAFELETQIFLASRFNYISAEQLAEFEVKMTAIQKMAFGLFNSLEK
jgi:four helix bundle protein